MLLSGKSKFTFLITILLLAFFAGRSASAPFSVTPPGAHAAPPAADFFPGRILLALNPGADLNGLLAENLAAPDRPFELHTAPLAEYPNLGVYTLQTAPGAEEAALTALRADPRVRFAERDARVQVAPQTVTLPNDPGLRFQWGLEKIAAAGAWALSPAAEPAVIAVLDSGAQLDHPDLAANLWTNPGEIPANGLDDDGNGMIDDLHGWRFQRSYDPNTQSYLNASSSDISDDFGHGTHVAGIAAAASDNGIGVAGVAPQAQLMIVKVLDENGAGWYSDIADGIVYAADNGADVINLSLGAAYPSSVLEQAVNYANERGVVVVAAAGNNSGPVFYPAAIPGALAVAASDRDDRRASFSNFGPQIDLSAPGVGVYSAWYNGGYLTLSGTSMAAPHVAGVVALLRAVRPDLTPAEIAAILTASADDLAAPGYDPETGWGRLNAHRAVVQLMPEPDLWVQLHGPVFAPSGEVSGYTVLYGNRGGGPAAGVHITSEGPATLNAAPLAFSLAELPPGEPQTLIVQVPAFDPGAVIHFSVAISSASQESLTVNNTAQATLTYAKIVYLPLVSK